MSKQIKTINIKIEKIKTYYLESNLAEYLRAYLAPGQMRSDIFIGRCPWRIDHRIGSFVVWLKDGHWRDFAIGEHGDVINLHQKINSLTFKEALHDLAKKAGLQ